MTIEKGTSAAGRSSVWYELYRASGEDAELERLLGWAERMYPHMLIEDVANRGMPYVGYRNRSIGVKLVPQDDGVERLVASALGQRRDLAGAVFEFGRRCLMNVVLFGEDACEIVYEADTDSLGRREFSFDHIPPRSLEHRSGRAPLQRVPKLIAKERHIPHQIPLPQDRLVVFEAPVRVRKHLPRILEQLAALSDAALPGFVIENLHSGTKKVPVDLKLLSRTKDMAVAAATKEIGWSGRAIYLFGEQRVVEHYWWYREFAFERFLIELRDSFLSTLNQALNRAGAECGFVGQIHFGGFPTLNDVDEAQRHLFAGDRSLTEINAAFRSGWDD